MDRDMYQEWHSSEEFNKVVMKFHDNYARQPTVSDAKAKLEKLKMEEQGLFQCMGYTYKGSTYEGVKIMRSDGDSPEFDLDFIIRGGECLTAENSCDSAPFYKLKVTKCHNTIILNKAQEFGVISPSKVMKLFYGSLAKCEFIETYNVKQRYHGPAVQLDVHYPNTEKLWFQVDLAPAFYLEGSNPDEKFSECFIAKSPDDESLHNMWYNSHSVEEKRLLDKAGGQRKVVLRTLKAMRGHSSQLSVLQSYHLKMALFKVMEDLPQDCHWTVFHIGQRIIDALRYIRDCLESGNMPNHFNKSVNLLKLNYDARMNLKNRLCRLITSKSRMYAFLNISNQSSCHPVPSVTHEVLFSNSPAQPSCQLTPITRMTESGKMPKMYAFLNISNQSSCHPVSSVTHEDLFSNSPAQPSCQLTPITRMTESGKMPNHFNKSINLLKLNYIARMNLKNQIDGLIKSESKTFKFLNIDDRMAQSCSWTGFFTCMAAVGSVAYAALKFLKP